ncbi:MAG: hypothetical protein AAF443_08345 [Chlamydiota bacterium]
MAAISYATAFIRNPAGDFIVTNKKTKKPFDVVIQDSTNFFLAHAPETYPLAFFQVGMKTVAICLATVLANGLLLLAHCAYQLYTVIAGKNTSCSVRATLAKREVAQIFSHRWGRLVKALIFSLNLFIVTTKGFWHSIAIFLPTFSWSGVSYGNFKGEEEEKIVQLHIRTFDLYRKWNSCDNANKDFFVQLQDLKWFYDKDYIFSFYPGGVAKHLGNIKEQVKGHNKFDIRNNRMYSTYDELEKSYQK